MHDKLFKLVIFIPALNEEEKIGSVIEEVHKVYEGSEKRGFTVEILVVDDGSTDNTYKEAVKHKVDRIVSHPKNLGLGAACRTGMQVSYEMGADVCAKLDADFQHDPRDIERCIMPIIEDRADIVWGSRFKGEIKYKMPLYRRWGNIFFSKLVSFLTNYDISDGQTGLICFNRRYLSQFQILNNYNSPQQLLIDANSKNMRYLEVPVVFYPRETGKSFVNYKYLTLALAATFRMLIYASPLKVFIPLGIVFFGIAASIALIDIYHFFIGESAGFISRVGTVLLFGLSGLQTIFFGILADLIIRKK